MIDLLEFSLEVTVAATCGQNKPAWALRPCDPRRLARGAQGPRQCTVAPPKAFCEVFEPFNDFLSVFIRFAFDNEVVRD